MKNLFGLLFVMTLAGCTVIAPSPSSSHFDSSPWRPIGNRKARVVHWGIVHNHSQGKWDAVLKLTNDFEMVGWVDDSASTAMRMQEPKKKLYEKYPCFTPRQVFEEVKPDLIVVECSNSELVGVSTEIARHGIPMHMDKPLGTDPVGFSEMSRICETRGVPLQVGYMFRSNEAINKMVELAKGGVLGEIYSVEADLDHNYGYPKYPEYASHYPGGTAYLLACHAIEWAMPIFNDELPLKTYSIVKPAPGDPVWAKTHTLTIMEYPRANCVFRVCSKGTQPCRHIRIDGTDGSMELEPIEDFRTVKHTTGLNEGLAKVDRLEIRMFLKKVNAKAQAAGYHNGINRIAEGALGEVKEVWAYDDRCNSIYQRPAAVPPPKGMDWNLWCGGSPICDYYPDSPDQDGMHPHGWHSWIGYGNGSIGNLGMHIMDVAFWALGLKDPDKVTCHEAKFALKGAWAFRDEFEFHYPTSKFGHEVTMHWWDGLKDGVPYTKEYVNKYGMPFKREHLNIPPRVLEEEKKNGFENDPFYKNGVLFVGSKANLWFTHHGGYRFMPRSAGWCIPRVDRPDDFNYRRVTPKHFRVFYAAIRAKEQTNDNFEYSVPLAKTVCLGNIASLAGKGSVLQWDGQHVTNNPEADKHVTQEYRKGWDPFA